ncbi:MAG: molybdopterin molybdotransferase MoeA [Desulfocapsaceae bacterium]
MQLDEALHLILGLAPALGQQMVLLKDSFGRVCSENNRSRQPLPGYDQSTRDGYAICGKGRAAEGGQQAFTIRGEIQAGFCHTVEIEPGEAYRIMTGGLLPIGAERVIAQEDCRVSGSELLVGGIELAAQSRFIRRRGSDHLADELLVEPGTRLNEYHLSLLAAAGNSSVEVFKRPKVAFFCSGSELVMSEGTLKNGQKYSSNHLLLENLVNKYGGRAEGYGVIADERKAISQLLDAIKKSDADIVISTGGVGPGKYDLFGELLPEAGAQILYRSLQVRPGRSTLFGLLGDKLYFGLPGPPSAVRILFLELLCPLLKKMQGMNSFYNQRLDGFLDHAVSLKSSDVLCFKDGHYRLEAGRVRVGYPRSNQAPNCSIMMLPGEVSYAPDDLVTISLALPD